MDVSTDFPSLPSHAPKWNQSIGVGSALLATLALGFTEACLKLKQRPIPLRFALRFAVANVLPSAVWKSIPAHYIAAASGLPLSALIHDTAFASSHTVAVGKRLILIKSIQTLRLVAGSYGLAYGLWHWHEAADTDNDMKDSRKTRENIVRLAPATSALSKVSRRKHGDHILIVPTGTSNSIDVNWNNIGIQVTDAGNRMKLIEVELSDGKMAAYVKRLKTEAMKEGESVCTVAVLPLGGPPMPPTLVNSFDVHFNPLSAILTYIASVCHERGVTHVILSPSPIERSKIMKADTMNEKSLERHLSASELATGLLNKHGITTSIWTSQQLMERQTTKNMTRGLMDRELVFFIAHDYETGYAATKMRESGKFEIFVELEIDDNYQTSTCLKPENAFLIVEESLAGQRVAHNKLQAESSLPKMSSTDMIKQQRKVKTESEQLVASIFSVADVTDQTLQGIRDLLRQGKTSDTIQREVYRAFGPQRVPAPLRLDQFSNLHI
ncbi:hypothetical protein Plhal710r2_c009g0040411 [Plasmopara halstedii]